jgi:UDP-N-acetylglucosamine--N-acetylmuramyl-(pentapeptide) pyrophosphoryl-undecaprenol N-acetylglucosamine transferase
VSADPTIAFTGGGTGGHIYPGLAVIEALRRIFRGRIVWIGSEKEADRRVVEAAGVEYFAVPSGKLRRRPSLENIADTFRVLSGYVKSKALLRTIRPVLLFSKGGYVSVPPSAAAASLGIPVFTHESDWSPGLATRLNARRAERIIVAYEATRQSLPKALRERTIALGNPLRPAMLAGDAERGRAFLGSPAGLPLILVLGGSQGAAQVNGMVIGALPSLLERAFVVHQTGEANEETVAAATRGIARPERYRALPYIREELPDIMAAATIVVSRAGAGGIWEAGALGKPMVLVPLAAGSRGDQVDNARHFEALGAAKVLLGARATAAELLAAITAWLDDPEAALRAGAAAKTIARPDAAERIAALILERTGARP